MTQEPTTISIPVTQNQAECLDELTRITNLSRSEVLRRAILLFESLAKHAPDTEPNHD